MVPIVEHELLTKQEQSSWPSCFVEFALHNLLFFVKCSCWITINYYQKQWLSFGSNWKRWKRIPEFLSVTHGDVTLNMWLTITGKMIFLWWIFVSSVPTFLCLVFKFQLIFHKESTMCIINMSSNCSNCCSIVFPWHLCVDCLHFESGPWLYPNIPSE
jgi:hypothetical protein